VANALWLASDLPVDPAFVERAAELHSIACSLDFTHVDAARSRINSWVKEKTKLKAILPAG
jgi:serine protease inhibitor